MSNVTVTLLKVELGIQVPKFGGGTYPGAQLTYEMGDKLVRKGIHEKAQGGGLAEDLKKLKAGDTVIIVQELIEKDGKKFNNIKRILPEGSAIPAGLQTVEDLTQKQIDVAYGGQSNFVSKKTGGYDVQGAIKGNAVTNGVQIAISQKDTSLANIVKQARIVLEAHKLLDAEPPKKVVVKAEVEEDVEDF